VRKKKTIHKEFIKIQSKLRYFSIQNSVLFGKKSSLYHFFCEKYSAQVNYSQIIPTKGYASNRKENFSFERPYCILETGYFMQSVVRIEDL